MVLIQHMVRRLCSTKGGIIRNKLFGRYLLVTNTLTSGTLMGTGDFILQTTERAKDKTLMYDWKRTGRMAVVGVFLGPFLHVWYSKLDKFLPGNHKKTVLKKVLADQIIASPSFLFLFFTGIGTLEGKSFKESMDELREKFLIMYLIEWVVWPPAQAINFYVLPPHLRVVYVNMLVLIWDCFLSYMKHKY